MADSLLNLYSAISTRPSDFVMGWRNEEVVRNDAFLKRVHAWNALACEKKGRSFALYLDDSIEFGAALLGCWHAGKTVWLTADTLDASCQALARSVDGFFGEFPEQWKPSSPDDANEAQEKRWTTLPADFPALVVHTSGSTGAAQAIPKNLSQLASEVGTLEKMFGSRLQDATIVATVSHQHIYGLLFKVLWPLLTGRGIHARIRNFPDELLHVLKQHACALIASPAYLKRLPDHLAWQDAKPVRAVFSSGGPLSVETGKIAVTLLGSAPIEIYGSSETGGIAWRQHAVDAQDEWIPFPSVEWRLADENLLEVRSPHLSDMQWYRLTDRAERRGENGFLLQGRVDRIVKIEEKRISLDAVESALLDSELVSEVRVLLCDDGLGQRQQLAAFIVLSTAGKVLLETVGKNALNVRLRERLAGHVESVGWPRRWRYLEHMPLNTQGKTTRSLLMAYLNEERHTLNWQLAMKESTRVELQTRVDPDLAYFKGHFPGAPILPGVVQLDWAIENGRRYFDLPPHFRAVRALKFQNVIFPGQDVTLELIHDVQKDCLNFRCFSVSGQHASGRVFFAVENALPSSP